jgi:hypothetical protein
MQYICENGITVLFNGQIFVRIKTCAILVIIYSCSVKIKDKGLPQQTEVAHGVPGRLRPRIFLTLGTARVVVRQP